MRPCVFQPISSPCSSFTPSYGLPRPLGLLPLPLSGFGQQRSMVSFFPSPPYFRQHFCAMLLHILDDGTRRLRLFIPRSPDQQFQECRRQVNPFLCKPVVHTSPIILHSLRDDDPCRFELL